MPEWLERPEPPPVDRLAPRSPRLERKSNGSRLCALGSDRGRHFSAQVGLAEAIELAPHFSTEHSPSFINGARGCSVLNGQSLDRKTYQSAIKDSISRQNKCEQQ